MEATARRVEKIARVLWDISSLKSPTGRYHNTLFDELNDYRQNEWRDNARIVIRAM